MKSILFRLFAVVVAAMAVACSPSLESQVENANKQCPIKVAGVGQITSIDYKDNTVVYNCLVQTRSFNLAAFEGHEEEMKTAMMPMLSELVDGDGSIGQVLVDNGASLAVRYYTDGPGSGSVTVSFSPDELKAVMAGEVKDDPETKLKTQVEVSRVQCPVKVDGSTTLTDIKAENGYVVYIYEIVEAGDDEDVIDSLNDSKEEIRETLRDSMSDKTDKNVAATIKACKDANYGIIYKYVGQTSGKVCEVKFESSEL
ncbi:MAG: hypothetical protein NC117_03285 [Pseudoflavonifractor sp.]|nr:hypothetical protein [Pseudoflavonifractor sp.]